MKLKTITILFILALLIPAVLVFRSLLSPEPLAWGDSVHFYKENFEEFVSFPRVWVERENNFGGVNRVVWLYPIMLLIGALGKLGIPSEVVTRIVFYFPAVILSFFSASYFVRKLGLPPRIQFFSSLLYTLNTYFLLLVDGGQAGVFLAYSVFPLALIHLKRLLAEARKKNIGLSLLLFTLLTIFDPRVALVCLVTLFFWILFEALFLKIVPQKKKLLRLIIVLGFTALISLYWLIPLLSFGVGNVSAHVSTLKLTSLLNGLVLYQPHWPQNIFGVITYPPYYFVLLPILILGVLLIKPKKKELILALLFLSFVFLVKGETHPLGEIYKFLVETVPFGVAIRDSTKFFIPTVLFGGVLVGILVEKVGNSLFSLFVYGYILLLVFPALAGRLNGNLRARSYPEDFQRIYENLRSEKDDFRTLWFPERHALSFQTEEKPALDAKSLVELTPFAFYNTGTYDKFNFLRQEGYLGWFRILGIKYLVFSGDPREVSKAEVIKEWEDLNAFVATQSGLIRKDWGKIPVYEIEGVKHGVFSVKKVLAVVGPYTGTAPYLSDFGLVFLEDGLADPEFLHEVKRGDAVIAFNFKDEEDFVFTFLSQYFRETLKADKNDWAPYGGKDYLEWKYQLLTRGLALNDLDFGKGVSFSTEKGEKMEFSLEILESGNYLIAVRGADMPGDVSLKAKIDGEEFELDFAKEGLFSWKSKELFLKNGERTLTIENPSGLKVVNVVALIPKKEFENAKAVSEDLLTKLGRVEVGKDKITGAGIDDRGGGPWLVLSESHNSLWGIQGEEVRPIPFYSVVNGFYVGQKEGPFETSFKGKEKLNLGFVLSLIGTFGAILFVRRKNV
ncbi:MAG: hypothetical protein ACOYT7_02145 [Patescibacteria group bacterium]